MAIAVRQIATANGGSGATISPTLSAAAVAGNYLLAIVATELRGGYDDISGITFTDTVTGSSGGSEGFGWYVVGRVAAGGETSFTHDSGWGNHTAALIEVEGFTGTATLDDSATGTDNSNGAVSSQDTGTATASAAGFALAVFVTESHSQVDGGRTYSNSFAEELSAPRNTRPGIFVASKAVTAGNVSCTFSNTEGTEQFFGCVLVLVDDTGGGGIAITQGAAETLVIAEQAATVGLSMPLAQSAAEALVIAEQQAAVSLSIPIAQGSAEALTITEHAATVTLDAGISITQGAAETLVIAEQQATVGLSIPLAQSAAEALAITEHQATVGLGVPIAITQGAAETLVLAEQAATVSLSMPIAASLDALTIKEWPATVTGGVEEILEELPQGGHYWPDVEYADLKERSARERRAFIARLIEGADEAPEPVQAEIKDVIASYQKKDAQGFSVSQKGIARLANNLAAVERLIAAYQDYLDDEDATVLLLVA